MKSGISSHNNQILNPRKNILDAIAELEMSVLWKINGKHLILCMKTRSLAKPTMNINDILVLLKHHSKKDGSRGLKNEKYEKYTELSKYIWTLKSHGITLLVKWSIVEKLCLTEKF